MTDARPALAKLATDALAAQRISTPPPATRDRAHAITLLASAIESEGRLRRRRRWAMALGAAAVAAGAIGIVTGVLHRRHGASVATTNTGAISGSAHALSGKADVVHEGHDAPLDGAVSIVVGDRLRAPDDARAAITLSTGTHLVLQSNAQSSGDLSVVEQDATQTYRLDSGALHADVAKLLDGQRFVVRTSDAEIEVRGTSFDLSVVSPDASCGGGTKTRLVVTEGVVVVRASGAEVRVPAGSAWPPGCGKPTTPAAIATSIAPVPETPKPGGAKAPSSNVSGKTAETNVLPASELAAQNDLFAQATAARNAGNVSAALAGYERYLAKYPKGPLAESATVERMRLLAAIDTRRAAVAAKAYLARYPNGFARAEAERLVAEAP